MSTVVHVKLENGLPSAGAIDDLPALQSAVRDRTKREYAAEALRFELTKAASRLLRELQRDFVKFGIAKLKPLTTASLAGEAPTIHADFAKHIAFEIYGEVLPAGFLFPPAEGPAKPSVSRPAVLVSLLGVLRDDPFASDERLAERLRASFAHVDAAVVASLRETLEIPVAIRRPRAPVMLAEAVARLAPAAWLRRKLDETLRLGDLRATAPPWPTWWRLENEKQLAAPGETLVEVGGDLVRLRTEDMVGARTIWDRHAELLDGRQDGALREAFANLVANAAAPASPEIATVLRSVAATGRWPEPLRSSREALAVEEVAEMLEICPRRDWGIVLDTVRERKLAARPDADGTDVLIELLAHAAARGA